MELPAPQVQAVFSLQCRAQLFYAPGACLPSYELAVTWFYWILFIIRCLSTAASAIYTLYLFFPWRKKTHRAPGAFVQYYCVVALISNISGTFFCLLMTRPGLYGASSWIVFQLFNIMCNAATIACTFTIACWAELAYDDDLEQALRRQKSNRLLFRYRTPFAIVFCLRVVSQGVLGGFSAANTNDSYTIVHRIYAADWIWYFVVLIILLAVVSRRLIGMLESKASSFQVAKAAIERFRRMRNIFMIALCVACAGTIGHAAVLELADTYLPLWIIVQSSYHLSTGIATAWFMIVKPSSVTDKVPSSHSQQLITSDSSSL